jgi:hypothetical protein
MRSRAPNHRFRAPVPLLRGDSCASPGGADTNPPAL